MGNNEVIKLISSDKQMALYDLKKWKKLDKEVLYLFKDIN